MAPYPTQSMDATPHQLVIPVILLLLCLYDYHYCQLILIVRQGPEWVWPVGFFLRAYHHFSKIAGVDSRQFTMSVLSAHLVEMQQSPFRGIPELTNAKGAFCPGSNPIQAWSMSCIMEVLQDLQND